MSKNPFDCYDEPGGFNTESGYNSNHSTSSHWNNTAPNNVQSQLMSARDRTFASQQRSLASIARSEQIGAETCVQLDAQGEKLRRAETRLDDISEMQKESQRSLNVLSKWYGGLKNWFAPKSSLPTSSSSSTNGKNLNSPSSSSSLNSTTPSSKTPDFGAKLHHSSSYTEPGGGGQQQANKKSASQSEDNLSAMSEGMSRLNALASSMNAELRSQNDCLDRINPRTEQITDVMGSQQRQMNRLLGNKAPTSTTPRTG